LLTLLNYSSLPFRSLAPFSQVHKKYDSSIQ
jgi:hypothetical protein